jgi:hypothetical protein
MAKQLVNPIERHVEKAILGVAVLLLIGVVVRYLVASPNQIEIRGELVAPDSIDAKIAQTAANVRERIRRASVELEPLEPLLPEFEAAVDPFKGAGLAEQLPLTVATGPAVPLVDPFGGITGQAKLVEPVAWTMPAKAVAGRSTYLLFDRNGNELRPWANWVTLSAVFDVKAQMEAQGKEYGRTYSDVVFGAVELQRRARRADGSWSDEDWQTIEPWPGIDDIPDIPELELVEVEDRLVLPSELEAPLQRSFEAFSEPLIQLDLIRPMMVEIINGTPWTVPIITRLRDVLFGDDYYMYFNEPPAVDPLNRYVKGDVGRGEREEQDVAPAELIAQKFAEAERLLSAADKDNNENDARRAWNLAQEVALSPDSSAGDKSRADRIKERANRVEADIKRRKWRGGVSAAIEGADEEAEEPVREPLPTQQVWAHDARPGSIQSGRVYQYRLRVNVLNQLAGMPDRFENEEDAAVVFVPGPWTEPVEVAIEPSTYFFATGEDDRKGTVAIEFYQWFEGVWLKEREKFGVGERLVLKKVSEVPAMEGDGTERTTVTFRSDATVVDIDFDRPVRERKAGATRDGVRFAPGGKDCCAVFADSTGRLEERCVETDKARPDKKTVQSRVWRP